MMSLPRRTPRRKSTFKEMPNNLENIVSPKPEKRPEKSVHYNTPVEAEEEEQYVAERVVDKRLRGLRVEYHIKWKGYGDSDNTWESMSDLKFLKLEGLISDYETRVWRSMIFEKILLLAIVVMALLFTYMFITSIEF